MEFPFGRQASKDSLLNKTSEAGKSLKSSFTSGSSRLFGSVMAKKNGIFDGISNTFDQVMTIGGNKEDEEDEGLEDVSAEVPQAGPQPPKPAPRPEKIKPQPERTTPKVRPGKERPTEQQNTKPKQPPPAQRSQTLPEKQQVPKPAPRQAPTRPPARPSRPPAPKSNGSIRGQPGTGKFARQQTAPADYDPTGESSDMAINFDEPMYGRQYSLRSGSVDLDRDSGFQDASNSTGGGSNASPADGSALNPPPVSTRISKNPFLDDPMPDSDYSAFTKAEGYGGSEPAPQTKGVSEMDPISGSQFIAGALGSDLLPGIPRVPSNNTALLAPRQPQGRDLLAITPTSGEALPLPSLEPTQPRYDDEIYDVSDGDSEATEGCDEIPDPDDYGGADFDYGSEGPLFRSGSVGSDKSWHSNQSTDSQLDDTARACRDFMKSFVTQVFSTTDGVSQSDKANFGQFCQHAPGRLWFARYVNAQRVHNKCVDEQVFYRLVQYLAVALFECNEADDYNPAKTLMNMCFTFYHEVQPPSGPTMKHFLYSYLKEQSIWKSLRFWNAAFFDAVQHERARRPTATRRSQKEGQIDDKQYQENITFGQLGTFTCNMRAFGLSRDLCLEFIRKQATIANLKEEQVNMLKENVER